MGCGMSRMALFLFSSRQLHAVPGATVILKERKVEDRLQDSGRISRCFTYEAKTPDPEGEDEDWMSTHNAQQVIVHSYT